MKTTWKSATVKRIQEISKERNQKLGGNGIKFDWYSTGMGMVCIPHIIWRETEANQTFAEVIKSHITKRGISLYGLSDLTGLTLQQVAQGMKFLIESKEYVADCSRARQDAAGIHKAQ